MSVPRVITALALVAGAVYAYVKATEDKGGHFDPDRPGAR